jgi:hypothetical protein
MKKYSLLLSLTIIFANGCSATHPSIPVVGMSVNNDTFPDSYGCSKDKIPYILPNGKAAVCWPIDLVQYVVCTERLSVGSVEYEQTRKTALELSIKALEKADANTSIKTEDLIKESSKYVNEGSIADARALAIKQCSVFLKLTDEQKILIYGSREQAEEVIKNLSKKQSEAVKSP